MSKNPTQGPTWYEILGVPRDATPEQIKAAWRAATDKFEPGSGTGQFRLFNEGADVLLDPQRRAAYDAELDGTAPDGTAPDGTAPDVADPEVAAPKPEPAAPPPPPPALQVPAEGDLATTPAESERRFRIPRIGGVSLSRAGSASGRLGPWWIGLLAFLATASLVLTVLLAIRIQQRVEDHEAGPEAAAAAERALAPVFSFDYRQMEADRDRAVQYLTPAYEKKYLKTFNELIVAGPDGGPGPAVKTKAVVTADVVGTGVVDAESDRVRVVAFLNQSSVKGEAAPTLLQNRLVVTMVLRDGDWLIDDVKTY